MAICSGRMHFWLVALLLQVALSCALADDGIREQATDGDNGSVQLLFFWSSTCPHCQAAHPFVDALPRRHPWIALESLELSRSPDNVRRFQELAARHGQDAAVPAFLFCGEMRIGWESADSTGAALERDLMACREQLRAGLVPAAPAAHPTTASIGLPWGGNLDVAALSLPALTLLLAGLDAFNPCAFFVLLFLLSLMAREKSRPRMTIVGGIFVAFSGIMYFAFMAAWLNVFQLLGQLAWITAAAGCVALLIGALNVKDFFVFGQGPSLSLGAHERQGIFRRARQVIAAARLPAMIGATVLLALAANFYELLCTAGFPLVYTRLLTLHVAEGATRYAYLALYNAIYVLPLAAIVAVFVRTLSASKLSERQGRLLKLLSGLMMFELGLLLLFAPELTANALATAAAIALAVLLTFLAARRLR